MSNSSLSNIQKNNGTKGGNVRTGQLKWTCPEAEFEKMFRDLGLPSSRILRTDMIKMATFFPSDNHLIMFFFGLLMADGYVKSRINYGDGTRTLVSLVIAITDKGLLEVLMERINAILTLEYPDAKGKVCIYMQRRRKEHHKDIWRLVVPKNIASVLMTIYESLTDSVCSKVLLAKRLLLVMAHQQQSLRLQGISWCATVASLKERYRPQFSDDNGSLKSTVLSLAA
jgi:hypothetical protein